MLPTWTSACLSLAACAALFAFFGLRAARLLEGRVRVVRRLLLVFAAAAFAAGVGVLARERLPLPPSVPDPAMQQWLRAEHRDVDGLWALVAACLFAVSLGALPVAVLLRDLEAFVLAHRLDLAARDAVLAAGSSPQPPPDAT